MKEENREYCHCPQMVSSISEESAYIVGVGAYIYCLNKVSLESTCQGVCGVDRRWPPFEKHSLAVALFLC